ncbi:MAG TPA: HAMP domain-containing sensor histidine kinase [Solirubrobacteraceae bacterium]|jgi:two-component system OmpR family sensor kinase|nr:HAMP domain-containing sensor histidine kinase [Solirubrobacteraceae bacterium]
MASLRARVLVSVLALAATGMVALAAVTYAEQRSFLESRADQQARSAVGALSQVLDNAGFRPAGAGGGAGGLGGPMPQGGDPDDHKPQVSIPPGTYGQRRDATGKVLGAKQIKYSSSESLPAMPTIPAKLPLHTLLTVDSTGSGGLHYRVYAQRDPEDAGITVAAVPLSEVDSTLHRLLLVEALVIAGVLLALGSSAYFVVRLGLRPLSRIEVTAGQIAAGDLSRRVSPATTKTEVGRLGLALNAMLERLETAFAARTASEERLRQFLSDASHELRTPLASIRGYAELFRMGATGDQAGTETAMRRIEEESKRMGILVEDLLTLARLDEEPDRDRSSVDLAALARDAVHDARARAPEREIALAAPDSAVVWGDPLQLRQVYANLLGNALAHTPEGTPVEVTVTAGAEVCVSVRDHGPGIPPEARERLFERFWRREGGRERGKAGAGLGLAIVHGVVHAHRGSIEVHDAEGGGSEFLVKLPSQAAPMS